MIRGDGTLKQQFTTTRHGTGFDYSLIRMLGIKSVRVDSCSEYSCLNTVYLRGLLTRASNKLPAPKTFEIISVSW